MPRNASKSAAPAEQENNNGQRSAISSGRRRPSVDGSARLALRLGLLAADRQSGDSTRGFAIAVWAADVATVLTMIGLWTTGILPVPQSLPILTAAVVSFFIVVRPKGEARSNVDPEEQALRASTANEITDHIERAVVAVRYENRTAERALEAGVFVVVAGVIWALLLLLGGYLEHVTARLLFSDWWPVYDIMAVVTELWIVTYVIDDGARALYDKLVHDPGGIVARLGAAIDARRTILITVNTGAWVTAAVAIAATSIADEYVTRHHSGSPGFPFLLYTAYVTLAAGTAVVILSTVQGLYLQRIRDTFLAVSVCLMSVLGALVSLGQALLPR